MANKLLCGLCLASLCAGLEASTIKLSNCSGAVANLGPIQAAVGSSELEWSPDWGDLSVSWGTNSVNLGTVGTFEVLITPSGLSVQERFGAAEAFTMGLGAAITQGLLSFMILGIAKRLHPARAATTEL